MANPEHLARVLKRGDDWATFREQNPAVEIDLSSAALTGADLSWKDLRGTDLSRAFLDEADLSYANLSGANLDRARLSETKLWGANLRGASLRGADLRKNRPFDADFSGADLTGASMNNADFSDAELTSAKLTSAWLSYAKLTGAKMHNTDLCRASLMHTDLSRADLSEANLSKAILQGADLSGAELWGADLSDADLRSANLQRAALTRAIADGVRLWETQRAGWSISGIRCQRAFWDQDGKIATNYAPGEFERLYSEQTCIELFYEGGVSTFELNTLPALLHHLASLNPECNIRLKSIDETGGGARIILSVGDVDTQTAEEITADALQVYRAQLALRDKEAERLQIEKNYLESLFLGKLIPAMLSAGGPQNVFNAAVTGVVIASGESKVDFHQTVNDNSAILALLERMMERRADLKLSAPEEAEFETEIRSAREELQKKSPNKSVLTKSVEFVEKLATEALVRGAGTLGEHMVSADWQSWVHQLGQFLPHIG